MLNNNNEIKEEHHLPDTSLSSDDYDGRPRCIWRKYNMDKNSNYHLIGNDERTYNIIMDLFTTDNSIANIYIGLDRHTPNNLKGVLQDGK